MKKVILFLLAAALLLTGIGFAAGDVGADEWFAPAVSYVEKHGLMDTEADGAFCPRKNATRGEIVTGLHRLAGTPAAPAADFPDVAEDDPVFLAASWAADRGVLMGYDDGRFAPADSVTREQLAVFVYRYQAAAELSFPLDSRIFTFSDWDAVSAYAEEAMEWAVRAGIFRGDGSSILPGGTVSRAEAAQILMRIHQLQGGRLTPGIVGDGEYTVTFHYNADLKGPYYTVRAGAGETIEPPPMDPIREGYRFAGWYTAERGGELFDFATPITADLTLYAHWDQIAEIGPVRPPVEEK